MATDAEVMERLVEESRYVSRSTIVELNASSEPAVRSGPGMVVAGVDDAFRAAHDDESDPRLLPISRLLRRIAARVDRDDRDDEERDSENG
jgi:hypothetical protein